MDNSEIIITPSTIAVDTRGLIEKLTDGKYHSILRIKSRKGTIRANHYHKKGSHLCYLISGRIQYSWRIASNNNEPLKKITIGPGELFNTPAMITHAMYFQEDSEFLVFETSPSRKNQKAYENDVVREIII